ncbi:MAG: 16S rRNA (cytosine(1402)-N(4))-methyltransferase RsmH [Rickettsiales bacterium]
MSPHKPVMLSEMISWLHPKDDEVYIDGTFGAGGYSRAILSAADCHVYAIDRDPSTKVFAEKLEQEFPGRFVWLLGNFADMCSLVSMHGVNEVNGIVMDVGVSSMQIDQADRGFSFKKDGPLDMRMSGEGLSAADIINEAEESEIADILYYYGEEKASRAIAKAIVAARAKEPITRTHQLAEIIRSVVGGKHQKTDPATRSFQALRIHINQELEALESGLKAAERMVAPGGKLMVVTFHSLEDRLVKRYYHSRCGRLGEQSRHVPVHETEDAPHFFLPKPEKRTASKEEAAENPRARSATMRMMIKNDIKETMEEV